MYLWQSKQWPNWRYDLSVLAQPMAEVSHAQGLLLGRLADAGLALREQASLNALTEDVLRTSEIEGEHLDVGSVRSSIARRLGVDIGALAPADRHVEGVVEMVLDATGHSQEILSLDRLFAWHSALFPTGRSGLSKISVGVFRKDESGPMQVISGPLGRQKVHFEAPPADCLAAEMLRFLDWINGPTKEPPLIKAGLAHLWFVTLHPFDDGNGRIARAIGDLLLARADGSPQRFYSLSAQIQRERKAYYDILERTQKGMCPDTCRTHCGGQRGDVASSASRRSPLSGLPSMDVTPWLSWFLNTLHQALNQAHHTLDRVMTKGRFWQRMAGTSLNERQVKILNRLLDRFEGKLTSSKWATITKCSPDTALRDINDLMAKGVLRKTDAGGRSTGYEINER